MEIRVLLADDHTVVRDGIKAIIHRIGKNIRVVSEAGNGREVLKLAQNQPIDVFVLDLEMPELNGIETCERLAKTYNDVKVVFLSMHDDKRLVKRAISCGAKGYILKECAAEDIVRAIEEIYKGGYYFSPRIAGYLAQNFLTARTAEVFDSQDTTLTSRQIEILRRICEGLTEKEIARQLNISPNTVHVHMHNIMKKIDVHTKAGLIKYAIKRGIVQL